MVFRQARSLEETQSHRLGFGLRHALVNHQRFGHLLDDAQAFVKARERILIDHLRQGTLCTPLSRSRFGIDLAVKGHAPGRGTHKTEQQTGKRGLAATRFPNQPQNFTSLDRQRNVFEHVPGLFATEKALAGVVTVLRYVGGNKRRFVVIIGAEHGLLPRLSVVLNLLDSFDRLNDLLHFVEVFDNALIALLLLRLEGFVELRGVALCFHAARLPAVFNGLHVRQTHAALNAGKRAAAGKGAAVTELFGRRNFTLNRLQSPLLAFHIGHGLKQPFGVRVCGIGKNAGHGTGFQNVARVHDTYAVGNVARQMQIVRDKQHAHRFAFDDFAQFLEDFALHHHVKSSGRFVGNQQLGCSDERQRNHHALAHAARELVRVASHAFIRSRDAHTLEIVDGQRLDFVACHQGCLVAGFVAVVGMAVNDCFAELISDGTHRI